MLFQKPQLITLIAAPKCSFKNLDWSPLQQPQKSPSKTQTGHPYNSLKNVHSKHGMIPQILKNDSLTSSLKHGLISSKWQPQKSHFQNTDWFFKFSKMITSLLLSETWTDFQKKKILFPKHGLIPQILKNDSLTFFLWNMDWFPPKKNLFFQNMD